MSSARITTKFGRATWAWCGVAATGVPPPPHTVAPAISRADRLTAMPALGPADVTTGTSGRGSQGREHTPSTHEFVPDAVHGEDELRLPRLGLHLLAQPGHVHVHRARGGHGVVAPH